MNPSNKVVAATTAGTIASAVTTLLLWLGHDYWGIDPPAPVQAAVLVLVTALCTGLAAGITGYLKRENNPSPSGVAAVRAGQGAAAPQRGQGA